MGVVAGGSAYIAGLMFGAPDPFFALVFGVGMWFFPTCFRTLLKQQRTAQREYQQRRARESDAAHPREP